MSIENFLVANSFVLEKESKLSSYGLVLIEQGKCMEDARAGDSGFPEVHGYNFYWGIIAEYRIDDQVIWNCHFQQLLEKFTERGGEGCEMVMRCLAYFDLDYWPDGTPFWGEGDVNLFWGSVVDRPDVKVGSYNLPDYVHICHGTETDSLSISCLEEDEDRARTWIGEEFLPVIVSDMIRNVEASLSQT